MTEALIVSALAVIAIAAVTYPILVGRARYEDPADLDADVGRYRAALDAGTVCAGCRFANPPGSRFCAECGRELAGEE